MSEAAARMGLDEPAPPLTVRALERALRRRILSWGPDRPRDSLARLREDVEHALRG